MSADPFATFRSEVLVQTPLRAAITAAYRRPETECVPPLLELAALAPDQAGRVEVLARSLATRLRGKTRSSGVEGLIHEYSLSSQEGVALMCLAEHVVGEGEAARLALVGGVERLLYGAAGDELLAQEAHGDVDAGADDRLAAARDETGERGA